MYMGERVRSVHLQSAAGENAGRVLPYSSQREYLGLRPARLSMSIVTKATLCDLSPFRGLKPTANLLDRYAIANRSISFLISGLSWTDLRKASKKGTKQIKES